MPSLRWRTLLRIHARHSSLGWDTFRPFAASNPISMSAPQFSVKLWASALLATVFLGLFYLLEPRQSREQKEIDVSEAVFRKLLEMPDVSRFPQGKGVCIANQEQRFDSRFLQRFQSTLPGLRLGVSNPTKVQMNQTQDKCEITLFVSTFYWFSSTEVELDAGYYCGLLCAYGGSFHVRRAGWGWHVDSLSDRFVS